MTIRAVHLSTYDNRGGAARAARRLHHGLSKIGIESQMRVQLQTTTDQNIHGPSGSLAGGWARTRPVIDRLPKLAYRDRRRSIFSPAWVPTTQRLLNGLDFDIVNLHWICDGYLSIESIAKLGKPIVWTLHDMWPLTGGCHNSEECEGYKARCGGCPQLASHSERDLSRLVWLRKQHAWENVDITIVAPSHWIAQRAKESSIFQGRRIEVIPNCIDQDVFRPIDKLTARSILGLPLGIPIIAFGAMNPFSDAGKGAVLLHEALGELVKMEETDDVQLLIFGGSSNHRWSFPALHLGRLNDDVTLALAYSAADIVVVPSRFENFPNVVLEAMACGTPCVAFNIGGLKDLVSHGNTGYLARAFDVQDLAQGLYQLLRDAEARASFGANARDFISMHMTEAVVAGSYAKIYREMLGNQ